MKKALLFIALILITAFIFTACATPQAVNNINTANMENPVVQFEDAKTLAQETNLNIILPDTVSNISYSAIINSEDEPIAQADFIYNDKQCTLRMQFADSSTDITGVYEDFENTEYIDSVSLQSAAEENADSTVYTLKYTEGGYGIVLWYDHARLAACSISMENCTREDLISLAGSII